MIIYWHVDDLDATIERLMSLGATEYEPKTQRGQGFVTASFDRPVRQHPRHHVQPHYLDTLASYGAKA